ncbi:MAG: YwqG family protein [Saprospiraceae bacterium]
MKNKQKLIETIEKHTIESYRSAVIKEIQPQIRLKTTGIPCQELGKTKLGGCPNLPKGMDWAKSKYGNYYLSFLAQINLAEVKTFDEAALLPNNGMLYFFFNLDSGDDGRVIFSKEINELERAVPPEEFKEKKKSFMQRLLTGKSKKRILKESKIDLYKEYGLPSWDSLRLEKIHKLTGTKTKPINLFAEGIFEESYEVGETEMTSNHHLLGNYKGIQHEFYELDCVNFKIKNIKNLTIAEIEKALKWRLLFQFDSDNNLEISWGDWGRIYFFIHEDDLKKQRFANVKILGDCY